MALTTLDLDGDALEAVVRLSGKRTKKDAVNEALREYAARHERIAVLEYFASVAQNWDHEAWQMQQESGKPKCS